MDLPLCRPGSLQLAVPHSLPGEASLLADVGPPLADELVWVAPVLASISMYSKTGPALK